MYLRSRRSATTYGLWQGGGNRCSRYYIVTRPPRGGPFCHHPSVVSILLLSHLQLGGDGGTPAAIPPPQVAALQLQQSPVCTATVCRLPARTSTWRHCRRLRNRCRHWRRPWLHIHACGEEGNQGRNEGGGRNDLEVGRQQQQEQPIGAAGYAIEAEANGEHCTEHGAPVCHAKPCHAYINRMSIHKQDVYT